MQRRPNSIFGLTIRFLKLKWLATERATKIGLVVALVAGGLAVASSARCMLRSTCGASGGCPYSSAAAASDNPCAR